MQTRRQDFSKVSNSREFPRSLRVPWNFHGMECKMYIIPSQGHTKGNGNDFSGMEKNGNSVVQKIYRAVVFMHISYI